MSKLASLAVRHT